MSITNPHAKTKLFGFNIPNLILYVGVALIVIVMVKIGNIFSNLFKKIKTMFGFGTDDSTIENLDQIKVSLEKDPAVKSQLNVGARNIAENIYNAVNGFGFDANALYSAFRSITGPNHMKAIYLAYGKRTVTIVPFYNFTGDLISMLKWRLTTGQYEKNLGTEAVKWSIKTKLNYIILSK